MELKTLFLFIGSLGLNNINTGELFTWCWGLGFYEHIGTLRKARVRHCRLINDLRTSSLLLEGDLEFVRRHDVVRDVAKSLASRFRSTYIVQRYTKKIKWPKVDQLQKFHYIIIPGSYIDELPEQLECLELKLLLLHHIDINHLKVPNNFFSGMIELRTLDLHGMAFTPSLPPSLHFLINLRSLNLYRCNLGDIRVLAKLTNLEILSLESSSIEELPKEIRHLTHLRMLNLTNCDKLKVIPANVISSLTCLEELYMVIWDIRWEVEGRKSESNNASLGELWKLHQLTTLEISIKDTLILPRDLHFLAKLERYKILIGRMWKLSTAAHETSRTLKLTESLWTDISLINVENLSFAKLKHVKDVLYELNEEGFPQLKHLHIQDSDELLHIITLRGLVNPHSAFPNLETLVLHNLRNVEEICHGLLPTHSLEKLKVIKVESCGKVKNLFPYSLVRNLSQLHEIEVSYCRDMTEIIAKEKQEDEKDLPEIVLPELYSITLNGLDKLLGFYLPQTVDMGNPSNEIIPLALFNKQVVMPKLEILKLNFIQTCKIWDDKFPVHSSIQNLTRLTVFGCKRLTSLFSSWGARALVNLRHLEIFYCSMLKEIFVQEEEVQFPNLERLDVQYMDDLRSIWPNQLAPNSFCKLKKIEIVGNKSLDCVFPISVVKELQQLQDLKISQCAIKNIVEKSESCDVTVVHVEKISIDHCHNMKTIVPSSVLFQTLDELNVRNCNGMVNIITPSTTRSLPKLSMLTISYCHELEEIYGSKNEDNEPLCDVAFMKLEELILVQLPRLRSFCQGSFGFKFRSLQMVRLYECRMKETFCHGNLTTPSHTKVHYGWGEEEENHWDGDLNTTIGTIFTRKSTKHDLSSSSKSIFTRKITEHDLSLSSESEDSEDD